MTTTHEANLKKHESWHVRECLHLQANQVNDVMWNIGLNPYDYLAECYGGIPDRNGIIREVGGDIEMMHPDAVSMPKHRYDDYMKVRNRVNVYATKNYIYSELLGPE